MTADFESASLGSIPSKTFSQLSSVGRALDCNSFNINPQVAGSNPAVENKTFSNLPPFLS